MATRSGTDYSAAFQNIWTNIQTISRNASSMKYMLSQFGTPADNLELRHQMQLVQFRTTQLARDTCNSLKDLDFGSLPPSDELRSLKVQRKKLLEGFSNAIRNFQSVEEDAERWDEAKDQVQSAYFQEMEAGVEEINQIFQEMAEMVRDQGELVEEIVANVDGAEIDVENGAQHLSTAETLMNNLRRNKCIIGIVVVVVLAVIIGIAVWQMS